MENRPDEKIEQIAASKNSESDFMPELDALAVPISSDMENMFSQDRHEFKALFRFLKKSCSAFIRKRMNKNFTNILYVTLDCPPCSVGSLRESTPLEYISEMRKQYPDKDIRVIIPIINLTEDFRPNKKLTLEIEGKQKVLEKTPISFTFFIQNRIVGAIVYKFPKNEYNIEVYGIYSPAFSLCKDYAEMTRLQFLAPFVKAVRLAVKKLQKDDFMPDIIHCENIPYYLGGEFESAKSNKVKVVQVIKDFTQIEMSKSEAFWAAINLADKKAMKKLCQDSVIRKGVANLCSMNNIRQFYQMKNCLKVIYKNYFKFRKYIDKCEDIEENIIFNRLNERTLQLIPQISYGEDLYFNQMMYTLKKADYWTVVSETYYREVLANPELSGKMFGQIENNQNMSGYVSLGVDLSKYPHEDTTEIYQAFDSKNFRALRKKNKAALIKEFSADRISTNFVDNTLFKNDNKIISGYLESFYESPLLFANPGGEVFANGVDILFNTILKLFDLHKNIQVIICIKDGMKNNYVKSWIEFLEQKKFLKGRWVFIDGDINPKKFLASSDMMLIPRRSNISTTEHFLAMNYGCVPIVAKNGILNDTIYDIYEDMSIACGFKTKKSLLAESDNNELFLAPVLRALELYQNNPASWNLLIKNCLSHDSSWNFEILEKYNEIYEAV